LDKGAYVELNVTKVLTTGAATAGKTCTKHYIFGLPPPGQYTSTDACDPMERRYYDSATVDPESSCTWNISTLSTTLDMIKNSIDPKFNDRFGLNILKYDPKLRFDVSPPTASTTGTQVSIEGVPASLVHPKAKAVYSVTQEQTDEIKKLLDSNISDKVLNVHWIHFVDGGGQSEFLELLPALVSNVTVTVYVIDLSKEPDEPCNDYFTINDQPQLQGRKKTYLTGKELFERFLKTICSQKDDRKCEVMFVGTHYRDGSPERNEGDDKSDKNLEKWNQLIRVLWSEYKADKVKIVRTTHINGYVHAISANSRNNDVELIAEDMRKELTKCCVERRVAIAEFLIEEALKSSSEAQNNKGILTYPECQRITKQYATENVLKKALQYFHELNEYFYFPDEGLVFTKPCVLVQIISKLIKVADRCRIDPVYGISRKFWIFGLVSISDKKSSIHIDNILNCEDLPDEDNTKGKAADLYYVTRVFEGEQLLRVLKSLSIAAYSTNQSAYFIPCVLPPCTKPDDINVDTRNFMIENRPLLLTFKKDKEGRKGSIPRGLFCGLVTHLIDTCKWEIHFENEQNYRTLIEFVILEKHKLVLVEDFKLTCIRVHADRDTDKQVRLKVREDIANGIKVVCKKFYGTESDSTMCPNASFKCSCSRSKENELSHIANVVSHETNAVERRLVCEINKKKIEFTEDQYDWLLKVEDPRSSGTYNKLCVYVH
jgi:hypothetical protein